jgi:hypothetical protein
MQSPSSQSSDLEMIVMMFLLAFLPLIQIGLESSFSIPLPQRLCQELDL